MSPANHEESSNLFYVSAASSLIFISLLISSAQAAPFTWQGPYAGAYFGGGFGNNQTTTDVGSVTGTSYFTTSADINAVNNAGTATNHPNSVIAGIYAGHDWIWKQVVFGVVVDYGALPLNSSTNVSNTYSDNANQYSVFTSMSTNWLFTLRGRLGYPVTLHWPSLFYFTGGMAMTQLTVTNNFSDSSSYSGTGGNSISQNQIGWTAGVGVELISANHLSMNIEYLYLQTPSVKTTSTIPNTQGGFGIPAQSLTSPFTTTGKFHASLLKIGLTYRFDE